jgi:WD40 repeat protein
LISISLAIASCTPTAQPTIPTSDTTLGKTATTSTNELGIDAKGTTCFSPHELLPFSFSPDNSQLLVRSNRGVQLIDLETGDEEIFLPASHPVLTAALSPEGNIIAWSLDDNSIQLIQVSNGMVLHTLTGHPDPVLHLRFSPVGNLLFSSSRDGLIRIWDIQTGMPNPSIEVGLEVVGIGVSPDGATLAVIPSDGPIQLWDIARGQEITTLGGTGGYDTSDAAFSPDSQYLATDLATGLFLWRLSDGRLIWDDVTNSMAAAYSPDGQYLAYSDVDANNQVFLAPPDAQDTSRVIDQMRGPVWELFFSPDSSLLAATDGIEIRVWRVSDGSIHIIGKQMCP